MLAPRQGQRPLLRGPRLDQRARGRPKGSPRARHGMASTGGLSGSTRGDVLPGEGGGRRGRARHLPGMSGPRAVPGRGTARGARYLGWPAAGATQEAAGVMRRTPELIEAVATAKARSGGMCEARADPHCALRGAHAHHRLPRAHGGKDEAANILWVCHRCHMTIHAFPQRSYERGWLVHSGGET